MAETGMLKPLAQVLREVRESAKVTQISVAGTAGCSQAVVSRFENGDNWPQKLDRVVAAYAAECDVEWLAIWERAVVVAQSLSCP